MISISSATQSSTKRVILCERPGTDNRKKPARVSREGTLDGGAVVNHMGVTDGDRTLVIKSNVTAVQAAALNALQLDAVVMLSQFDGKYRGAIDTMTISKSGGLHLSFLIESKISA